MALEENGVFKVDRDELNCQRINRRMPQLQRRYLKSAARLRSVVVSLCLALNHCYSGICRQFRSIVPSSRG